MVSELEKGPMIPKVKLDKANEQVNDLFDMSNSLLEELKAKKTELNIAERDNQTLQSRLEAK